MSAISVTDLTVGYGSSPVLTEVSLSVPEGSTTAILGASGDGKTTLLRAIAGFLPPAGGTVAIGGRMLSGPGLLVPPERRGVGYVRQDGVLFPHLDVAGNVAFGLPRSQRTRLVVADLLELVGLHPDLARRRPDQLSGGQQQRVALARALARKPEVVLLDEPFSSLDVSLRAATRAATAAALAERGATAVLVTHDQAEALSFADQVAVLVAGRIRQAGPPRELYEHPVDLAVARLLGEVVILDGTVADQVLQSPLGPQQLDPGGGRVPDGPAQLVLRPEQLRLVAPDAAAAYGTVTQVRYHGHEALVDVRIDGSGIVHARTAGVDAPPPGAVVGVSLTGTLRLQSPESFGLRSVSPR